MALVFEQHEVSCVLPAFQANPEQGIALGLRTLSNHETAFPLFSVTVDGYSDIERSATSLSDTEARGNKPFS